MRDLRRKITPTNVLLNLSDKKKITTFGVCLLIYLFRAILRMVLKKKKQT